MSITENTTTPITELAIESRMARTAENALSLWGMADAAFKLVAARENRVYCVDHQGRRYALRLHRQGLRSNSELQSELQWMAAISEGGLSVPSPIASATGEWLQKIDGVQIDMLDWLGGETVGATGKPLSSADRAGLFQAMGRELARLHEISDQWTPPDDFFRWSWNQEGLTGEAPLWGRFWENPSLSVQQRIQLESFRDMARERLATLSPTLDYGLIHADLVRENVMIEGDQLHIIDFDDSGFGYRLFDIATALLKNHAERDYDLLKASLLDGYCSIRSIDVNQLDLFLALRACTYVGWIMDRMDEGGAGERNRRFINTAMTLTDTYLTCRRD